MGTGSYSISMFQNSIRNNWRHVAQLTVVLLCAAAIKFYYSTASVNELRWILAPTASLVELISGTNFEFESHAGYMSSDHTFLIAASCAGVNFLLTSFLMLSLRKLWRDRGKKIGWSYLANAAVSAYFATVVANTARIVIALQLRKTPVDIGLSPDQLHRFEGIIVYFGFLLALFLISERFNTAKVDVCDQTRALKPNARAWLRSLRHYLYPLFIYYAITFGAPLANGAFRRGASFWEHSVFVLVIPWLLMTPLIAYRLYRSGTGANIINRSDDVGRRCLSVRSTRRA